VDNKDRRYVVRLKAGASFHTHHGFVDHDALLGQPRGLPVHAGRGEDLCVRPTLADVVLKMPAALR